jgi:hypothetical protein
MKVKVYSTQMGERVVDSSAKNWGELQSDLSDGGISFDNMKAVIGETKLTMDSSSSVVPQEDFTLFLMPKKTKAGSEKVKKDINAYLARLDEQEESEFKRGQVFALNYVAAELELDMVEPETKE